MQNVIKGMPIVQTRINKFIVPALILILLIVAGIALFRTQESPSSPPVLNTISADALEEQYGLRVNLLAVTGAGGFVDLRIKIVDGEKAKLLLMDKNNFPTIMASNDVVLNAPEDTKSQQIIFENGLDMFVLYPNSSNAVTPGSEVRVVFGDVVLEPITVVH